MVCSNHVSAALERALEDVRTAHSSGSDTWLSPGPSRRSMKWSLMEARRLGASWDLLAVQMGMDAAGLREASGCLPRHGTKPDDAVRRHGVAAGYDRPHCCKDEGDSVRLGDHGRHCEGERRCHDDDGRQPSARGEDCRRGRGPGQGRRGANA